MKTDSPGADPAVSGLTPVDTSAHYMGDTGTRWTWRECRWCGSYSAAPRNEIPIVEHRTKNGVLCPVATLEHACDDTCPANWYHEHTHEPVRLAASSTPGEPIRTLATCPTCLQPCPMEWRVDRVVAACPQSAAPAVEAVPPTQKEDLKALRLWLRGRAHAMPRHIYEELVSFVGDPLRDS